MEIGKINKAVVKTIEKEFVTILLDDSTIIDLSKKEMKTDSDIGETIDVFLYIESKDKIAATQKIPYAIVGEFDFLEVKK